MNSFDYIPLDTLLREIQADCHSNGVDVVAMMADSVSARTAEEQAEFAERMADGFYDLDN